MVEYYFNMETTGFDFDTDEATPQQEETAQR